MVKEELPEKATFEQRHEDGGRDLERNTSDRGNRKCEGPGARVDKE